MDRVRSLRKIPIRLRSTNFCTSSARFAPSFVRQPSGPECTQIGRNAPKHQFWVQWGGSGAFVAKCSTWLRFTNFGTSSARFALNSYGNQTVPNAPKLYETHQNFSLGSNGVDRVLSFRKIPMQLRGTNFCTSLARFAPSFVRQPNSPKCTQIVENRPKHEFRVQWGGSGAFVVKNYNMTSWHKLMY